MRDRAIRVLAARGEAAIGKLGAAASSDSVVMRRNAVWALSRIDSPRARALVRERLGDDSPSVRQAAVRAIGTNADSQAVTALIAALGDLEPSVRREAAQYHFHQLLAHDLVRDD